MGPKRRKEIAANLKEHNDRMTAIMNERGLSKQDASMIAYREMMADRKAAKEKK
jgi:hypothetical protein